MELTVQNVYGLLLRSKLMSFDEARTMYARWQDEAREHSTNLARFASWMVANKYLTDYQATLLARGHADGFFINEYKILDRLGKGRMAGVYKAQHRLGQIVAIKVLPPSKAKDSMYLGRFQREAKLALKLRHPNIVRAFQVGVCGELHYLVMEHLEGATVEEVLLERKRLPAQEAVRLVYQALLGLAHIGEQGLVHRDLKPSNLMLVPAPKENTLGCTLKILDIGLGRALMEEGGENPDPGLTGEGVLLGTPDYMAPEQARDPRLSDIRADIYSLGCVLYHLLTGQPPFPDTNIISQMIRHSTETPRPVKEFNAAVPDGLQQILNWMMAKEQANRYPTPDRAARALEVFLAAESATASSPDLDPGMRSYLDWLDTGTPLAPESVLTVPTEPLVALPGATSGKTSAGDQPRNKPSDPALKTDRTRKKSPRESKKRQPPRMTPPAPDNQRCDQAGPADAMIEVELVTAPIPPAMPPAPPSVPSKGLSRRDFVMFFLGVGSGLAAYAIGRGLAAMLDRARPQEEPPGD